MQLKIIGSCPKVPRKLIREACHFYTSLLMSSRLLKTIEITIHLQKTLWERDKSTGVVGLVEDGEYSTPRIFDVYLQSTLSKSRLLEVLAHELVHVTQYAKGVLKEYNRQPKKTRFSGQYYYLSDDELSYADAPWEIEAYGREYGLVVRFLKSLTKKP